MAEETKTTEKAAPKAKAKDAAEETPSALAAKEAGALSDDASDEEKVAWNEKYTEAKLKARRG